MTPDTDEHADRLPGWLYEQCARLIDARLQIGRLLKDYRGTAGLSRSMLADAIGVPPEYLRRIEDGHAYPDPAFAERVIEYLGKLGEGGRYE